MHFSCCPFSLCSLHSCILSLSFPSIIYVPPILFSPYRCILIAYGNTTFLAKRTSVFCLCFSIFARRIFFNCISLLSEMFWLRITLTAHYVTTHHRTIIAEPRCRRKCRFGYAFDRNLHMTCKCLDNACAVSSLDLQKHAC